MDDLVISAPGKVIIHGEHTVVYGYPALVTSLDRRTYIRVQCTPGDETVELDCKSSNVRRKWTIQEMDEIFCEFDKAKPGLFSLPQEDKYEIHAFLMLYMTLRKHAQKNSIPMKITVTSFLPIGAGVGSSASFSVCLSAALLVKFGIISDDLSEKDKINVFALECERIFHQNPSGVDNTICCYGGTRLYNSGKFVQEADMAREIPEMKICLIDTKIERSTYRMVREVRLQHEQCLDVLKPIFECIETLTIKTLRLLAREDRVGYYDAINRNCHYNQKLLEALRVSHRKIEDVCDVLKLHELEGKLTGGGGGGCVITFLSPDYEETELAHCLNSLLSIGVVASVERLGRAGVVKHQASEWETLVQD